MVTLIALAMCIKAKGNTDAGYLLFVVTGLVDVRLIDFLGKIMGQ